MWKEEILVVGFTCILACNDSMKALWLLAGSSVEILLFNMTKRLIKMSRNSTSEVKNEVGKILAQIGLRIQNMSPLALISLEGM